MEFFISLIFFFTFCICIVNWGVWGIGIFFLSLIVFIWWGFSFSAKAEKRLAEIKREQSEKIKNFKSKFNIPESTYKVHYIGNPKDILWEFLVLNEESDVIKREEIMETTFSKPKLFTWLKDDTLMFFIGSDLNKLNGEDDFAFFTKFSINEIKCFYRQGDAYTDTKILGGGSSLGGAIIGGVIAGGAGAIIGSREEVKGETTFIDKRSTILVIENSLTSKNHFLIFDTEAYEVFLELIPEKERSYVEFNSNTSNANNPTDGEQDVIDLLIKYKQLKDDGVITDEEFEKKKKELLKN